MYTNILFFAATTCAVQGTSFYGREMYERTPLGDAIDKASMKLLNEAYKSASDKNVVTSPLGMMVLLSLYSAGAGPEARQQISTILGGGDYEKISEAYSHLSRNQADEDPSYLTVANKIYVADRYKLADQFSSVARTYNVEVETLNFGDAVAAADTINQWADEKTKGHIKDPMKPASLNPIIATALINIIFFQGHWHVPFEKSDTQEKDFHVNNSTTVKKPTMHLLQSLFYTENKELGVRMIELPYKENGFRMVVVLPDEIDGLPKVLEKVTQTGLLTDVFNLAPAGRKINLDLPKFEVKSRLDLNDLLPKVGVSSIFTEDAPGIVKDGTIRVTEAFQEAFVKVDEEGATAGAFNGLVSMLKSMPLQPNDFKVDHPFIFLILYQDKVLFAGTYTH